MHQFPFEKLEVWNDSRLFVKKIYLLTKKLPDDEKFGLISQIRRAGISIVSNIAEGTARKSYKDQARFIQMAYGSLLEILNQLIICNDLGFINDHELLESRKDIELISNKLNALYNYQIKKTQKST